MRKFKYLITLIILITFYNCKNKEIISETGNILKGNHELRRFKTHEASVINFHNANIEFLRLESNGDIYVKGRLIENDKEVVDGMRQLLRHNNIIK